MGMNFQVLNSQMSPGGSADMPTSFLDYVQKSTEGFCENQLEMRNLQ
jgi:hypothetical protein